jgi:hypothetical protein
MVHVMMMLIPIDVNVQKISWAIDANEVHDKSMFTSIMIVVERIHVNNRSYVVVEKSCSSPQCFNGGVCVNTVTSFKCICPIDYEGQRCDLSK